MATRSFGQFRGEASKPTAQSRLRDEFIVGLDQQLRLLATAIASPDQTLADPPQPLWWWVDEDGHVLLRLRFRGITLKVRGDADTALLGSLEEAFVVLTVARAAAVEGKLDGLLAAACI